MRKLELKDIVGYLPYNLLIQDCTDYIWIVESIDKNILVAARRYELYDFSLDEIKPLLRPMSDFVKPIKVKGYNDDKEFVPLVELAKINFKSCTIFKMETNQVYCGTYVKNEPVLFHSYYKSMISPTYSLEELDLLNQFHFDYRGLIDEGLAIDINTVKL